MTRLLPALAVLALLTGCAATSTSAAPSGQPVGGRATTATSPTNATSRPTATSPTTAASTTAAPALAAPAAQARTPAAAAVNPCAGNTAVKAVRVSITAQHLWMCARGHVAYSTPVTTGMDHRDTRTPTGNFHIQGRNRDSVLTLDSGKQYDVKYWIPFQAPSFGFHDSSWQHFPYGSPQYRTDGSHGCVHMPLTAIAYLYRWATIGTPVHIAA